MTKNLFTHCQMPLLVWKQRRAHVMENAVKPQQGATASLLELEPPKPSKGCQEKTNARLLDSLDTWGFFLTWAIFLLVPFPSQGTPTPRCPLHPQPRRVVSHTRQAHH